MPWRCWGRVLGIVARWDLTGLDQDSARGARSTKGATGPETGTLSGHGAA